MPILLLVAILAACQAAPEPTAQPTAEPTATPPGEPVQVVSHCGLAWPVVEYAGAHWKFDADHDPNAPPGWTGIDTVYIETLEDGTVRALGPDGLVYRLVETNQTEPDGMCM
jgi:hypothetical protein